MEQKIPRSQAVSILNDVYKAEMSGDYSQAFQLLSVFWNDFRVQPNTSDFSEDLVAEIFLRCGSIAGYLGRFKTISNAQERSRKLLSDARQKFKNLGINTKIVECDNYLALTYERTGEISRARECLEQAFSLEIPPAHPARLYSHIIDSLLNLAENNFALIHQNSLMLESLFQNCANKTLQGCFFNHYGLALKNLGRTDEALDKFLTARLCFFEAAHHQYCGALENNIARLFTVNSQFAEAHNFALKAVNTFKLIGDFSRQGYALDTRANIFLTEGKYENALDCADKAVKLLQNSENKLFLLETFKTKIKSLIFLKRRSDAADTYAAAKKIAGELDPDVARDFRSEMDFLFTAGAPTAAGDRSDPQRFSF